MPIFYDPMISKLITWGDTRDTRCADAARAGRVRGPRHPDHHPVLPVDARRRGLQGRPLRHQVHRSQAGRERRHAAGDRAGARGSGGDCRRGPHVHQAVAANGDRGARAQPLARRGQGGRAADDLRGGDRRSRAHRQRGPQGRPAARRRSTAASHVVDARARSDESALSLLVQSTATRRMPVRSIDAVVRRAGRWPATSTCTSTGRTIPVQVRPAGCVRASEAAPAPAPPAPVRSG